MDIIKHQLNLFIVPFVFKVNDDYKGIISKIDSMIIEKELKQQHDKMTWQPVLDNSEDRFFEHINQLVPKDENTYESTIGKLWRLNPLAWDIYGLPKNKNNSIIYHTNKKKNILLKIFDVQLYLFETGVGFLIYEINYPKINNMEDLIQANYIVKKLNNFGGTMHLFKNKANNSTYEIKSNFADITTELLAPLKVSSYFGNDNQVPKHALVFNTTILDENFKKSNGYIERLEHYLFETRRVFKESYLPDRSEFNLDQNEEVYRPFENSVWGISLEGASNIVFHTENETTNNFFSDSYIGNVKLNYFYLYIIALHQHYALLNLSVQAAEIPRKMEVLIKSADAFESIKQLREDIAYFDLRSSFLHVSHITHQNKVYQYMYRNLYIGDLHRKLHSEVESIASLLEIRKTAIEKEELLHKETRRRRNDNFYVGVTTFFVFISTSSSIWSLCKAFLKAPWSLMVFGISVLVIATIAVLGVRYKLSDKDDKLDEKNKRNQ